MATLTDQHNTYLSEWMRATGLSQAALGAEIGKTQTWVSERLAGKTDWKLKDLDLLIDHGIPVGIGLYGCLNLNGEVTA